MMDLFTVVALIFINAFIITSGFAFFTAIGNYWVRRPAPQWLNGAGLYCHRFLDGLEYTMTRTAAVAGMARNVLVLKCLPKMSKPAAPSSAAESVVASPPIPERLKEALAAVLLNKPQPIQTEANEAESSAPEAAPEAAAGSETPVTPVTPTPTPIPTSSTKKLRSRSRILPPGTPKAAST